MSTLVFFLNKHFRKMDLSVGECQVKGAELVIPGFNFFFIFIMAKHSNNC